MKTLRVKKVEWIDGGIEPPCSPTVARREIKKAQNDNGQTTPRALWKSQRRKDAPLHECFEWDEKEAASKHRDSQARLIMRCLVVTYQETEQRQQLMVNTQVNGSKGYEELQQALAKDREIISLSQARSMVARVLRQIQHIEEASKLVQNMNEFLIETV